MEHIFFYALEKELGRSFVHGEPVGTGAVVADILDREGASSSYLSDWTLSGCSSGQPVPESRVREFERTMGRMKEVAAQMGYHYWSWTSTGPLQKRTPSCGASSRDLITGARCELPENVLRDPLEEMSSSYPL